MGYVVKLGEQKQGYCSTKAEAYEIVKALCGGEMPLLEKTSFGGVQHFSASSGKEITVIPNPFPASDASDDE